MTEFSLPARLLSELDRSRFPLLSTFVNYKVSSEDAIEVLRQGLANDAIHHIRLMKATRTLSSAMFFCLRRSVTGPFFKSEDLQARVRIPAAAFELHSAFGRSRITGIDPLASRLFVARRLHPAIEVMWHLAVEVQRIQAALNYLQGRSYRGASAPTPRPASHNSSPPGHLAKSQRTPPNAHAQD